MPEKFPAYWVRTYIASNKVIVTLDASNMITFRKSSFHDEGIAISTDDLELILRAYGQTPVREMEQSAPLVKHVVDPSLPPESWRIEP